MPLGQREAERALKLLWEFRDVTENPEERKAYETAISTIHAFVSEIVPASQPAVKSPTRNNHVLEIRRDASIPVQVVELRCGSPGGPDPGPGGPASAELAGAGSGSDHQPREKLGIWLDCIGESPGKEVSPIVIVQVTPGGVAAKDGRLRRGDQVLEINGRSLSNVSLERARWMLESAARSDKIQLSVISLGLFEGLKHSRPPLSPLPSPEPSDDTLAVRLFDSQRSAGRGRSGASTRSSLHENPAYVPSIGSRGSNQSLVSSTVGMAAYVARGSARTSTRSYGFKNRKVRKMHIMKEGCGLGIRIVGGKGSKYGDMGIFIKNIEETGAAYKDGRLKPGDELLMVDGKSLVGLTHSEAVSILRQSQQLVQLVIATEAMEGGSLYDSLQSLHSIQERELFTKVVLQGETTPMAARRQNHSSKSPLTNSKNAASAAVIMSSSLASASAKVRDELELKQRHMGDLFDVGAGVIEAAPAAGGLPSHAHPSESESATAETSFSAATGPVISNGLLPPPQQHHDGGGDGKGAEHATTGSSESLLEQSHKVIKTLTPWARLSAGDVRRSPSPSNAPSVPLIKEITYVKSGGRSIGFTICGGRSKNADDGLIVNKRDGGHQRGDIGLLVKKIRPGGLAAQDSRLRIGDELLEVNGRSLEGCTHTEAASIIKGLKSSVVTLKVRSGPGRIVFPKLISRSSSVRGTHITVVLQKIQGLPLGMMIAGMKNVKDQPVAFVKRIMPGSPADKCGLLQHFDQIVAVEGKSIIGQHIEEVKRLLSTLPPGEVHLKVVRPEDARRVSQVLKLRGVGGGETKALDKYSSPAMADGRKGSRGSSDGGSASASSSEEEGGTSPSTAKKKLAELFDESSTSEDLTDTEVEETSKKSQSDSDADLTDSSTSTACSSTTDLNLERRQNVYSRPPDDGAHLRRFGNGSSSSAMTAAAGTASITTAASDASGARVPPKFILTAPVPSTTQLAAAAAASTSLTEKEEEGEKAEEEEEEEEEEEKVKPLVIKQTFQKLDGKDDSTIVISRGEPVDSAPALPSSRLPEDNELPKSIDKRKPPVTLPKRPSSSEEEEREKEDSLVSLDQEDSDVPPGLTKVTLNLKKRAKGGSIGITIVSSGGSTQGLFQVRRLMPGGVAAKDGRLRPGDRLVSLNGKELGGISHSSVLQALSAAPKDCALVVYRDPEYDLDASSSVYSLGSRSNVSGSHTSLFSSSEDIDGSGQGSSRRLSLAMESLSGTSTPTPSLQNPHFTPIDPFSVFKKALSPSPAPSPPPRSKKNKKKRHSASIIGQEVSSSMMTSSSLSGKWTTPPIARQRWSVSHVDGATTKELTASSSNGDGGSPPVVPMFSSHTHSNSAIPSSLRTPAQSPTPSPSFPRQAPEHSPPSLIKHFPPFPRHSPPSPRHSPPSPRHFPPSPRHSPPSPRHSPPSPRHSPPSRKHSPPVYSPLSIKHSPPSRVRAPPTPEHAPPTPEHAPPTPEHAPPTPKHAPPTPEHAPPTPEHALPTPERAPSFNKDSSPSPSTPPPSPPQEEAPPPLPSSPPPPPPQTHTLTPTTTEDQTPTSKEPIPTSETQPIPRIEVTDKTQNTNRKETDVEKTGNRELGEQLERPKSLGPVPRGTRHEECPFEIEVRKTFTGLGLTLGTDETGMVLVRSLTSRSPITKDGNIRVGDHILYVNGVTLINETVANAEKIVKSQPRGPMKIVAMAPPKNITEGPSKSQAAAAGSGRIEEGVVTVELEREKDDTHGIMIEGGSDSSLQYVFIRSFVPFSPAALCRKLRRGDQLVMMGNECLIGLTYEQAKRVMENAPVKVEVVAQRKKESPSQSPKMSSSVLTADTPPPDNAGSKEGSMSNIFASSLQHSPETDRRLFESYSSSSNVTGGGVGGTGTMSLAFQNENLSVSMNDQSFRQTLERFKSRSNTSIGAREKLKAATPHGTQEDASLKSMEETFSVELCRSGEDQSWGLTLVGGSDNPTLKDAHVKQVSAGGLAQRDGKLKRGDRIISINGKDLQGCTNKEVLLAVKNAGDSLTLQVGRRVGRSGSTTATPFSSILHSRKGSGEHSKEGSRKQTPRQSQRRRHSRRPSTSDANKAMGERSGSAITLPRQLSSKEGVKLVELKKGPTGLGMKLKGGTDPTNPGPVVVKEVFPGGPASKSGKVHVGDVIIEANGITFQGLTHSDAVDKMKGFGQGTVKLLLRDWTAVTYQDSSS